MQLKQIQQYKQTGTQIRSRIPPLTSIDEPSPMATIKESINQNKSHIPADTNHSLSSDFSPSTSFQSFIFFLNLWNSSIPSPDPTEYLCDLSPLKNKKILQILSLSPLTTSEEIRFTIKTFNKHFPYSFPDGFTAQLYNSLPSIISLLTQSFNNNFI